MYRIIIFIILKFDSNWELQQPNESPVVEHIKANSTNSNLNGQIGIEQKKKSKPIKFVELEPYIQHYGKAYLESGTTQKEFI